MLRKTSVPVDHAELTVSTQMPANDLPQQRETGEPLRFTGQGPRPVTLVDLGLPSPIRQGLRMDLELFGNTTESFLPCLCARPCVHDHPRVLLPMRIEALTRCCRTALPPVGSEPLSDPG